MSDAATGAQHRRVLRWAAASAVLLALAGYLAVRNDADTGAPVCVVRGGTGEGAPRYELTPAMAANAATISAVGTGRGLPERAVTIALATALQESALRNIDYGDRDSLGLFQQRPSKGWGSPEQILDPVYAAGKFYDGLVDVPGYARLPLTVAAQRVQRSGFPQAYAKHEPDAALLAAALTGRAGATLSCVPGAASRAGDPERVRAALAREFGPGVLPGNGAGRGAAAREILLSVPPGPAPAAGAGAARDTAGDGVAGSRRGWELAHWAVARADGLRIEKIAYGGKVWSAGSAREGWRPAAPGADPDRDRDAVRLRIAR
ncbi:hypothetical protein [Streptomyces yaizuensis]|uniref:Heavy metal transporter n=1 Tax=Streptomyces yaizuensis TaxID=2989713 RepID=A0ABQ5NVU3_9ACTN|nr:hypothetical protein [Streptomyces sp. YSPA8]GLF94474.1 heavy metal transporter [Streptomyces sp. YSPA8]